VKKLCSEKIASIEEMLRCQKEVQVKPATYGVYTAAVLVNEAFVEKMKHRRASMLTCSAVR